MKSHMNLGQRTLAILGATGTAALMALPAFAQAVPTQGVVNNGDINRLENQNQQLNQTPSRTSDNCAYTTGGVGGPIDSGTSAASSSFDAAQAGAANGSLTLNQDLSARNSASGNNTQNLDSSYAAARINVPNAAGTSADQGAYANGDMSMNSNMSSSVNSTPGNNTQNLNSSYAAARIGVANTAGATSDQSMMSSTGYNRSTQSVVSGRQFDANNPSAAIPYRNNAYGTSGHEVKMNLDARQERQNSYPTAYNSSSYQAAGVIPVSCAPTNR